MIKYAITGASDNGRLTIGVDIDGVIYRWATQAFHLLQEVLPHSPYAGLDWSESKHTSWSWLSDQVSKEHWTWLWTKGVDLGLFRNGLVYDGAHQTLSWLSGMVNVVIISHRPRQAVRDTLAWLNMQRFDIHGLHIFPNQEPKSTIKCDIYLDDRDTVCEELALNTEARFVGLMDRPWNRHYSGVLERPLNYVPVSQVLRIYGWDHFLQMVQNEVAL